jgi:hypothetical protein
LEAWQLGSLAAWQLGSLAAWQLGSLAAWQLGSLEACQKRFDFSVLSKTENGMRAFSNFLIIEVATESYLLITFGTRELCSKTNSNFVLT